MSHRPETWRNHLLASLPTEDWNRWQKIIEPIHFQAGDVVYETGETIRYVYFPLPPSFLSRNC